MTSHEPDAPETALARLLIDCCDGYINRSGPCFATFGEVDWALNCARGDLERRWVYAREDARRRATDGIDDADDRPVFMQVMGEADVEHIMAMLGHERAREGGTQDTFTLVDEDDQLFCDTCGRYVADVVHRPGQMPRVTCGDCIGRAMQLRED